MLLLISRTYIIIINKNIFTIINKKNISYKPILLLITRIYIINNKNTHYYNYY